MAHTKRQILPTTPVLQLMEMPNGGASDIALKKEVIEVASALERIMALRPVTWYWKDDVNNRHIQHGFVAQEVEEIFPELVEIREQDAVSRKFLSTKGLFPYLVKAIEEQQQQIEALRQELSLRK